MIFHRITCMLTVQAKNMPWYSNRRILANLFGYTLLSVGLSVGQGAAARATARQLRSPPDGTVSINTVTSLKIPDTCTGLTTQNVAAVFRVVIKKEFDVSDPRDRDVMYKLKGDPSPLPDNDDTGRPDEPAAGPIVNPYHVDMTVFPTNSAGTWAQIRVVLRDDHYKFAEVANPLVTGELLEGLTVGGKTNPGNFCGLSVRADSTQTEKDANVRSFFVPIVMTPMKPNPTPYPFNIILVPKVANETPIVVDPKIVNNG